MSLSSAADMANNREETDEMEEERMLQLQLQADVGSEEAAGGNKKQGRKKRKSGAGKIKSPDPKKGKAKARENKGPEPKQGKAKAGEIKLPGTKKAQATTGKNKAPETESEDDEGHNQLTPNSAIPEDSGVPARIRAERKASNQVQLLVQWKNYPDEKDWTWELKRDLERDAPMVVNTWKAKMGKGATDSEGVIEHTVEKILSKKTYKGVSHYLVKWEGFEKVDDRTWEPCDRLKIDVPEIVEVYESKEKESGKSRK